MEKSAQHCGEQIKDVQRVQGEIKQSLTQETALKSELGGLNGIFKKKAREDCQRRLEEQEKHTEKLESYLKREHNTDYQHIPDKIQEYSAQAYLSFFSTSFQQISAYLRSFQGGLKGGLPPSQVLNG